MMAAGWSLGESARKERLTKLNSTSKPTRAWTRSLKALSENSGGHNRLALIASWELFNPRCPPSDLNEQRGIPRMVNSATVSSHQGNLLGVQAFEGDIAASGSSATEFSVYMIRILRDSLVSLVDWCVRSRPEGQRMLRRPFVIFHVGNSIDHLLSSALLPSVYHNTGF